MNHRSKKKTFLSLPFDLYGRYKILSACIQSLRTKDTLKILDVGGNIEGNNFSLLQALLHDDEVYVLDQAKNSYKNYIQGDALNLPFQKDEFDIVVSADVLEHIPQNKKERFLDEQFRVAKKGVLVAAPFLSKEGEAAENIACSLYQALSGTPHRWLEEHKMFFLPKRSWFESYVKSKGMFFQYIPHNHIPYWILMTFAHLYVSRNTSHIEKLQSINRFYNSKVFPSDHRQPVYRYIYVITKRNLQKKIYAYKTVTTDFLPEIEQKVFELIGDSNRQLLRNSMELETIKDSRGWKFVTYIHTIRKRIPILKDV